MTTETVRVDTVLMNRLRKYLARKTEGRTYGALKEAVETSIKEYLDKHESELSEKN